MTSTATPAAKVFDVDAIALVQQLADFVEQRAQILAGADHADGSGEDVVEDQRGDRELRRTGPMLSCTTTYTPPRTNMLQLSMYTLRTAKLNSMTPSTNQGADFADGLFRRAAGIKGGRGEIAQNDRGAAPETDEGKRYGRRDDYFRSRQRAQRPVL